MIGKPYDLTLPEIIKIAEAVKLAENATDLDFKTGYKIARLGDAVDKPVKTYTKLKTAATRTFQESEKTQDDVKTLQQVTDAIETQVEPIHIPEFSLSEFYYSEKDKEKKGKLKVPQGFLNRMIRYITEEA
jgi:hypothetical protein